MDKYNYLLCVYESHQFCGFVSRIVTDSVLSQSKILAQFFNSQCALCLGLAVSKVSV